MRQTLYRQFILDHYRNPRNKGEIKDADITAENNNPFCADSLKMFFKIKDKKISDVKFLGQGCVLSQAGASMTTELARSLSLKQARKIKSQDILRLFGTQITPGRFRCALLAYETLGKALNMV